MRKVLIGGELVDTGQYREVINPSTGEAFESVSYIKDRDLVRKAIDLAFDSFDALSKLTLRERAKILLKASEIIESKREEIARLLALEAGKPIKDSRVEVLRAISLFRIAAEEARFVLEGKVHRVDAYDYPPGNENRIVMEVREPLGVVAAILPFNFPANSFAHKVAPNIIAGNTVIVKPSTYTPLSALEMASVLYQAGLPKGSLSVLVGDSSLIGDELISSKKIGGITFTGSTRVGLALASKAVSHSKRIMMEMGGSDPIIVFEDSEIERAIKIAVRARFEYSGQNCNAGKRIIVQDSIYKLFIDKYVEEVSKLKVGDALDENIDLGPVISQEAINTMEEVVKDASEKAKVVFGGFRLKSKGFHFSPTVIAEANTEIKAMREEVFGPVVPIAKFSNIKEAIDLANSTDYGLQSAIFTKDLNKALKVSRELKFGAVIINDSTRLRWDSLPFGGVKMSGVGNREGVRSTIMAMTEPKIVSITLT
jgi:succinyl-CoA reductase